MGSRRARILVVWKVYFVLTGQYDLPQSHTTDCKFSKPRNLTESQNWPHMIKNNLFNYLIPSGRKLEVLGPRKQMWKAQIEHMCLDNNIVSERQYTGFRTTPKFSFLTLLPLKWK